MFSKRSNRYIAGSVTVLASGYAVKCLFDDEGTRRSIKFWINVLPVYLHYRSVQFAHSDLKALSDEYAYKWYENLHDQYTDKIKDLTYDMKGFYLKHVCILIGFSFFYYFQ